MFNKIIVTGNIVKIPEIQITRDKRQVATFSLTAFSMWKDETGEWREHTACHEIIVFCGQTVDWIKRVLKRGQMVYVEGMLNYRYEKDKRERIYWTPYIVVSEAHGKIQQISPKNPLKSPSTPDPEQEDDFEDWDGEEGSSEFFDEDFQLNQNVQQHTHPYMLEEANENQPTTH